VTADNQRVIGGDSGLIFTAGPPSGSVNGVTGSPSFSCNFKATSPAGAYTITPSLGTLAAENYTFQFRNGVLSVIAGAGTGLYNPATPTFYLRNENNNGDADVTFAYNGNEVGLDPIAGDWDGNGKVTVGLYDPQTSIFYLRNSNTEGSANTIFQYGPAGLPTGSQWIPVAGDWNGDGKDSIGLYNPATSTFHLRNTTSLQGPKDKGYADVTFNYGWVPAAGKPALIPLAGDWNHDGYDSIGLYNPATSTFYLRNTTSLQGPNDKGYADVTFTYGKANAGWKPIAGDWDGNGTDTIGLYNPAISKFFLRNTNNTGYADETFTFEGAGAGCLPIAGDWNGVANACLAAGGAVTASANVSALTQADLQPIISEAISQWTSAGLDATAAAKLTQVQFAVSDLPGSYLGETEGNLIQIDSNAAGHGWFVDPAPALDEEFTPSDQQLRAVAPQAVDRIDLLTVVEHELGHILGLKDLDDTTDDLMSGVLGVGVRRDPSHQDAVDAALAS